MAACERGLGDVAVWVDLPSSVQEIPPKTAAFPQSLEPEYAQRLADVIAEIEAPSSVQHALTDDERAALEAWDQAIVHHREERLAQRGRVHDVPLPVALTTTQVQTLAADAESFLLNIVRPMPKEPTYAAKKGSAFHLWVEQMYGQQVLPLDDTLPFDDDEAELAELQARFLASEWASREPHAQEVPFTMGFGNHSVRGRVDAVYRDGDGFIVVDWKTNKQKTANPLQLAIYREAIASKYGVPITSVRACFFYVVHGETEWFDDSVDIADLLASSVQ